MSATVASIRSQLSPDVSAKYKDYQIERWIKHKSGDEHAVLRTIGNQKINEDRLREALRDADQPGGAFDMLNHNFMAFVPVAEQRQLWVFSHGAKEPKTSQEVFGQILIVTHYYILGKLEELFGEGATCDQVQDQRTKALNLGEMKARTQLAGEIGGRSFPFMIGNVQIVNDWGGWTKSSVNAFLGMKKSGTTTTLCSEQELLDTYDRRHVPQYLGGSLDVASLAPEGCGNMIKAWFQAGGLSRLSPLSSGGSEISNHSSPLGRPTIQVPELSPRGPGVLNPALIARSHAMPPDARTDAASPKDMAMRLGGGVLLVLLLLVRDSWDMILFGAGIVLALYGQHLYSTRKGPLCTARSLERMQLALVHRATEEAEALVRGCVGQVNFAERDDRMGEWAAVLAARLLPPERQALEACLHDAAAAWPAQLWHPTPGNRAVLQRWLVLHRWLQAALLAGREVRASPGYTTPVDRSSFNGVRSRTPEGTPTDTHHNDTFKSKLRNITHRHRHPRPRTTSGGQQEALSPKGSQGSH